MKEGEPQSTAGRSAWIASVLADASTIYQDTSADAGRLRARLLGAVLRLTPASMAANLGCALVMLFAFAGDDGWPPRGLLAWFLALVVMAGEWQAAVALA